MTDKPSQGRVVSGKQWIWALAVMFLLIAGALGYRMWEKATALPVIKEIKDFQLENLDGSPFHFSQTDGKLRFVSFIYTNCPKECPATTHQKSLMQERLKEEGLFGTDVLFLSIAFDPERDTPEVLRKYANTFQADLSGWQFVRGQETDLQQAAKEFMVGFYKKKDGMYIHTMKTFLVDREGKLRAIYPMAEAMDIEKIIDDMKRLARE